MFVMRYEIPIAAFRPYEAREFQESLPAPPPSTLLGMLMSYFGFEMDEREKFKGLRMASGIYGPESERSVVLRRMRRGAKKTPQRNPEFQELLVDVSGISVFDFTDVTDGSELVEKINKNKFHPEDIQRYGALSLGESSFMIDSIYFDVPGNIEYRWMIIDPDGPYDLTTWIDFSKTENTRKERFSFLESSEIPPAAAWVTIGY